MLNATHTKRSEDSETKGKEKKLANTKKEQGFRITITIFAILRQRKREERDDGTSWKCSSGKATLAAKLKAVNLTMTIVVVDNIKSKTSKEDDVVKTMTSLT